MPLKPINNQQSTWIDIHSKYNNSTFDRNIYEYSFDLNYKPRTVYKNFDYETEYKALIAEGDTQKNDAPYKKFQSYPYEKIMFEEGNYITFKYGNEEKSHWLLVALDKSDELECIGKLYKCNNIINIINNGILYSYPCYKAKSVQRPDFIYTSEVNIPDARLELTVQRNEQTKRIEENDRIILDGIPYKITHTDKHNNIDIYDRTGGLIYLICVKDSKQPDDDLENDIANKNRLLEDKESEEPREEEISIIVSPSEFEIIQGESQTYTVKKYVNGIESSELLTITDNSTMRKGYYELAIGNNEFTVKNLKRIVSKNVEISISDTLGNTKDISIKLKGEW